MQKIKKPLPKSKVIILLAVALVLFGTGGLLWARFSQKPGVSSANNSGDSVDLSPATDEDQKRADQIKEDIADQQDKQTSSVQNNQTTNKRTVKPVVTYAEQNNAAQTVEVGASVANIFEDGGNCTTTFTNGSNSFSKTVVAVKNVRDVSCPVMSASVAEFPVKGTWTLTVKYESPGASGVSDTHKVEVN